MSLLKSDALLFLGARNDKGLAISPDLKDQGIDLLRKSPGDVTWEVIPDVIQARYPFYRGTLPLFIKAFTSNKRVPLTSQGYSCDYVAPILPLPLPNLIMSWTIPCPEEVATDLRTRFGGRDVQAQGKAALSLPVPDVDTLRTLIGYKPNTICPTIEDHLNVAGFRTLLAILRIMSAFLQIHRYPAFEDNDHRSRFEDLFKEKKQKEVIVAESTSDSPMDEATKDLEYTGTTIYGKSTCTIEAKDPGYIEWRDESKEHAPWIASLDDLPNRDGLFIPYIEALHHFDDKTVLNLINDYFLKCLGDTTEDIIERFNEFRQGWGNIKRSRIGVMMSVIAVSIDIAIRGQAQAIPLFLQERFAGVIISGGAFTVNLERICYRPVSYDNLVAEIPKVDTHATSMHRIVQLQGNEAGREEVRRVTNMSSLRSVLLRNWTIESTNKEEILKAVRGLNFGEKHWNINVNTLANAFSLIVNTSQDINGIPIHYSCVFETDRAKVVWSCFGGMAPTFRIPGGRALSLEGPMVAQVRGRDGKKQPSAEITKVACRNVVLEVALRDLEMMMEKKEVLNPFATPNQRVSQMNQDRFFSGDDGKTVIAGLRSICKISAQDLSKGKRKASEVLDDEPGRKRGRAFDI